MSNILNKQLPKKLVVSLLSLIAIGVGSALVAFLLLVRFPSVGIAEIDLVEVHSDFSTIRIPRQWQQFPVNNGVQFGNLLRDGSSSATVTVLDTGFFQTNLVDAPTKDVTNALTYTSKLTELASKEDANCMDKKDLITSSSFSKFNSNTRELVRKRVECSTPSGKRVINDLRIAVGRDGQMRGLVLTVRVDDWRVNQKVYEIMLDSLSER